MKYQRFLSLLSFVVLLVFVFISTYSLASMFSGRMDLAMASSNTGLAVDGITATVTIEVTADAVATESGAETIPVLSIDTTDVTPEALPAKDGEQEATATPLPASVINPPVPEQGGTCITGKVIDRFEKNLGSNWEITAVSSSGATKKVSSTGNGFSFNGLEAGVWTVSIDLPEGWREVTPSSFQVTLNGINSNCAEVRFKIESLACLIVNKVYDYQINNVGAVKRVGIPDWEIQISNTQNIQQAITNGFGQAQFDNLLPGVWTVTEAPRLGWTLARIEAGNGTVLNSNQINLITPKTADQCQVVTLVNKQVNEGCIKVKKINTYNDEPICDWGITLESSLGIHPPQTAFTDKDGIVIFDWLPLGEWKVTEDIKPNWIPQGPTTVLKTVEADSTCKEITFENSPTTCIVGNKINHLDRGMGGWEIIARHQESGEEFKQITQPESGVFTFYNLPLGMYTVEEVQKEGWESVLPQSVTLLASEPKSPGYCEPLLFKNKTNSTCIDVFKKDTADGAGLAGWEITLTPAYGGVAQTLQTDGTGWLRFNDLPPGEYILSEQSQVGWMAAPGSPTSVHIKTSPKETCEVKTFWNCQTNATHCQIPW